MLLLIVYLLAKLIQKWLAFGMMKRKKIFTDKIPLRRFGEPEEVASAILYLASDEASFITGVVLDVNGGILMA